MHHLEKNFKEKQNICRSYDEKTPYNFIFIWILNILTKMYLPISFKNSAY